MNQNHHPTLFSDDTRVSSKISRMKTVIVCRLTCILFTHGPLIIICYLILKHFTIFLLACHCLLLIQMYTISVDIIRHLKMSLIFVLACLVIVPLLTILMFSVRNGLTYLD